MLGQKKVQNQTRFSADQTLDLDKSIMHMHHQTHTRAHGTHETDPSAMCSGRLSPTHRTRPTRLRCAAGGALCIEIRPEWAEKERRRKTRLRCAAGNSERKEK